MPQEYEIIAAELARLNSAYAEDLPILNKYWKRGHQEVGANLEARATFDRYWNGIKEEKTLTPSAAIPPAMAPFISQIPKLLGISKVQDTPNYVTPYGSSELKGINKAEYIVPENRLSVSRKTLKGAWNKDPYDVGTIAHELAHYHRMHQVGAAGKDALDPAIKASVYALENDPQFATNAKAGRAMDRRYYEYQGYSPNMPNELTSNLEYEADKIGVMARLAQSAQNEFDKSPGDLVSAFLAWKRAEDAGTFKIRK